MPAGCYISAFEVTSTRRTLVGSTFYPRPVTMRCSWKLVHSHDTARTEAYEVYGVFCIRDLVLAKDLLLARERMPIPVGMCALCLSGELSCLSCQQNSSFRRGASRLSRQQIIEKIEKNIQEDSLENSVHRRVCKEILQTKKGWVAALVKIVLEPSLVAKVRHRWAPRQPSRS